MHRGARLGKPFYVLQYPAIAAPGVFSVLLVIHVLYINKEQIGVLGDSLDIPPGHIESALNGRMITMHLAKPEKCLYKNHLNQGLPAGERHSAGGILIEQRIARYCVHHFFSAHFFTGDIQSATGAYADAIAALHTLLSVMNMLSITDTVGFRGARFHTLPAGDAFVLKDLQLRSFFLGFWIVAPKAPHVATF